MANPEHLQILNRGVGPWNEWRKKNEVHPDLRRTNLAEKKLPGINLVNADLSNVDLIAADLTNAALMATSLFNANLAGANLTNSDLSMTDLTFADVQNANLTASTIILANLNATKLTGANLTRALAGSTNFANTDLSTVLGLDSVEHFGPSTIGIDTLYNSKGKIPEAFLRGAGVPDDFIKYARSLITNPRKYYSCFISYSSKDKDFADRLHADLQAKAIRCWYAPEDLKIGDKFRVRIEESIRIYDKVMIVLSENSIQSAWVEDEVEAALERERQHTGSLVLFPIRLDDAVMETKQVWAASLRRTRHIGDFSNWKNHNSYQKGFERLLRDLKSQTKTTLAP